MKNKILLFLALSSSVSFSNASSVEDVIGIIKKVSEISTNDNKNSSDGSGKKGRRGKQGQSGSETAFGIQNIVTAKSFANGKADGTASDFPNDTAAIYVCFNYSGFKGGEIVQSIWYFSDSGGNLSKVADNSVTIPLNASSNICEVHHSIASGSKWQTGNYRVDIIARSKIIGTASFTVSAASASSSSSGTQSTTDAKNTSTVQQVFDIVLPLLNQGGSSSSSQSQGKTETLKSGENKAQGGKSAAPQSADTPSITPRLNYQGSPEGGVLKGDGFSINYQNGWKYANASPDTVIFTNFDEDANVILQKAASVSGGGSYADVTAVISDTKGKLSSLRDCSINDENEFTLNNVKYKPFSASYTQNNMRCQEWYVVAASPGNSSFYLFCYRSNSEKYGKYLGIARMMFSSLSISGAAAAKSVPETTAAPSVPTPAPVSVSQPSPAAVSTPVPVPAQPAQKAPEQKKSSSEDFSF